MQKSRTFAGSGEILALYLFLRKVIKWLPPPGVEVSRGLCSCDLGKKILTLKLYTLHHNLLDIDQLLPLIAFYAQHYL